MFRRIGPWTQQPPDWNEVDWASPLANELAAVWNGGAPLVESLTSVPRYSADNASLIVYRATTEGRSQGTSVSSANIGSAFKSYRPTPAASPFTIVVRFQIRAVPGADRAAVRFENQSGETASVSLLSTGAIRGLTIRANTTVDSDATYAAGAWITAVYTAAEGSFKLWINGVRQTATGTGSLASFQVRDSINIRASDVDVVMAGFWNRTLSDAEVVSVSANPWQLFVRRDWVFSNVAAGGGTHAATGALSNAGGATSGAAARTRAHPSSGSLANPGGQLAGSALHLARHTATGALTNPGATTAGAAARRVNHGGTGALANPGGVIAGTAARTGSAVTHPSSGALVNPGAQLAGTAARVNGPVAHPSTGTLANPGASLAGTANRTPAPVTHSASGALSNPGGQLVGFATNESGALVDTHDGFWAKQYRKMWERKSPTIAEIVEELEEEPQEVLQAIPEVRKEVAREMGGRIDYEAITRNLELQRVIAKQIQVAIELRYAQRLAEIDEEDAEILLLI